jgi:glycine oxidase
MGDLEGAGIPDPLLDFSVWCNRRHETLSSELYEASGIDNQFRYVQRVTLAFTDDEISTLQSDLDWQSRVKDYKSEWLDRSDLCELEPRVSEYCLGGVYISNARAVEPYKCTLAAAQASEKLGVVTLLRRVIGLFQEGSRCVGVEFDGGRLDADMVILAMGPWTGLASGWCGVDIPVTPLKGQMLRLRAPGQPLSVSFHYGSSYAASKPDGLIWAGTTEEKVGFDEANTIEARDSIMSDLLNSLPFLADSELIQQTACLRPWSNDGLPIVGKIPGWENLYVGTGGGRKGILWSTGMSQGLVDLILGEDTSVPNIGMLDLSRFL